MADVLSQSQIDDLLKNLSSAGDKGIEEIELQKNDKKLKVYDFRTPKKFTKERLKVLSRIFEIYSRLLSSYLTSILRLYCKVNVISIEEQRYYEFNNALPEYVMMCIFDVGLNDKDIEDTSFIMQISNPVAFTMLDRMLGGNGSYVDINRDFTEIEIELLSKFAKTMCGMQKEAWGNYIEINPTITDIETNPRVIQSIAPDDVIILVLLEVEIRNVTNTISICIPAINLEQMMTKFNEKNAKNKRFDMSKESERKAEIMGGIKTTPLTVKAVLGETQLQLKDILQLQVNDIISLNAGINDNVTLKIGETKWFDGKLGAKNNKKAVKIDNTFKN